MHNENQNKEKTLSLTDDSEEETGANEVTTENKKELNFYPRTVQSLSEKDLKSPAVLKMVLSENKELKREREKLKEIEKKFYESERNLAIVNEKLKKKTSSEIFTDVVYTVGGLIIAISTLDFNSRFTIHNGLFILIGLLLIVGAAIAQWGKK